MTNTVLKAKNTFSDGLIMDFSPDNTKSTSLTSALNATLLTFNGNELTLQNDMGNGRVETAYLPEGYIPVGTCEFGDIIYIVSYNPITNKSLIGCFPSPERNISSDELDEFYNVSLSSSDFVDEDGLVKATSIKKILMLKSLNPGDKYIIFTKDRGSNGLFDEPHITDVGNTSHLYNNFPKLLKIHIVSIDDSNKIDYLDSTVKWYDKPNKDYFINNQNPNLEDTSPDLDSYRNVLSSGYSVFLSKVSGKLALLIELEKIDTFSCTNNIYKVGLPFIKEVNNHLVTFLLYDVYFNVNWGTSNYNINPSSFCLYNQKWTGLNSNLAGLYLLWEKENNKYVINTENSGIYVDFPEISFCEDNKNYYNLELTRCYKQESTITYEDFIKNQSYDVLLTNSLNILRIKLYIKYEPEDLESYTILTSGVKSITGEDYKIYDLELELISNYNIVINKVNINKDNYGIPILGLYYINAFNSVITDNSRKYYTSYNNTDIEIFPYQIYDDIINNYFSYPVIKKFASFMIPIKLEDDLTPDISNLIYNYELAPVMPYGILPDLKISGYINFSKIGSGEINLTQWKYYNTENTSTLTFGLNILPELNMGVAGVFLEFIDNQGLAATYTLNENTSYSGLFTDLIPLNNSFLNYKFLNKDSNGKLIYHAGLQIELESENAVYQSSLNINDYTEYLSNNEWVSFSEIRNLYTLVKLNSSGKSSDGYYTAIAKDENNNYITVRTTKYNLYTNDSGIIYSNFLYLVRIVVLYCNKDALDNYDTLDLSKFKVFYRWYWTNTMFNDKYYNTSDFESLLLELSLDVAPTYSSNSNYKETGNVNVYTEKELDTLDYSNNFGTVYLEILGNNNIDTKINVGLLNTYDTFSLLDSILNELKIYIYKGKSYIEAEDSTVTSINGDYLNDSDVLHPSYAYSNEEKPNINNSSWDKNSYKELYNWQNLVLNNEKNYQGDSFEYIGYDNQTKEFLSGDKYIEISGELNTLLSYNAINFNNYYKYAIVNNLTLPLYKPLVYDTLSAKNYGFLSNDNLLLTKYILNLTGGDVIDGNPLYHMEGLLLTMDEETKTHKWTYFLNSDIKETSIRYRFDNNLDLDLINEGFCIIRFYDYKYGLHYFDNSLVNAYVLGSPNPDCRYGVSNYQYNNYTTYFSVFGNNRNRVYIATDNLTYTTNSYGFNFIFPAFINLNKEIFIINSPLEVSGDMLLQDPGDIGWTGISNLSLKLLNILTQIWVKSEETHTELGTPTVLDIVYLKPYTIKYTYDLLYRTNILSISNTYLTIRGIKYNEYINSILCLYSVDTENYNINLKLNDVLKNCPLSFLFNTQEIGFDELMYDLTNTFFRIINKEQKETYIPVYLKDTGGTIYYLDGDESFKAFYSGTIYIRNWHNSLYRVTSDNTLYDQNRDSTYEVIHFPFNSGFEYKNSFLNTIVKDDASASIALSYLYKDDRHRTDVVLNLEHVKWNDIYKNIRISDSYTFFYYP